MASLRVGIVAGESSGDILGSALMQALRQQVPDVQFSGIGGALMTAAGLESRVPMERLAVMGLVEPLKRLPELLRIRRDIIGHFIANPPDVFIGIDSPDFNLGVELRLRAAGIRTIHYVSPSVWAWRRRRIRKIAAATDLVLTLFPFEADFYHQHGVPVAFVGHPLADEIPLHPDTLEARQRLGLPAAARVLALLPGSRQGEVARLAPAFLETARLLAASDPELHCVLPCATPERRMQVEALLPAGLPRLHLLDGQSRTAMAAADAVLLASGTATLEALLLKKPMLVCYRMAALSYVLISRMLKVPYFSLPNLLAGRMLVEELVQDQVAAPLLVPKMRALLAPGANTAAITAHYLGIHQQLRGDASARAAHAVLGLL